MEIQELKDEDTNEFVDVETPNSVVGSETLLPFFSEPVQDVEENCCNFLEQTHEINYDSIEEFCFESDELALKQNLDYKNLLEAMVVLESQRLKAIKDLETLDKLKSEALADPQSFFKRLQNNEKLNFPSSQKVYQIPTIDWKKYALDGNSLAFEKRQSSFISKKVSEKHQQNGSQLKSKSASTSYLNTSAWSTQEEKSLITLLSKFPNMQNEAQRYENIAAHMSNRTPMEIATKVYHFLSLEPIDGEKLPNLTDLKEHWKSSESGMLEKRTTSLSLKAEDTDLFDSEADMSDDDDILPELRRTPEYQELVLMKKVLQDKLRKKNFSQRVVYQCYRCKTEPIAGVRWHCVDCKLSLSVDFCDDCAKCLYETEDHSATHQLERHHINKGFLDRDYMHFLGNDYNYLDPNYMPAT